MAYLYVAAGFALLFGGGEWLVRGAVALSRRFGLSPLLIGMTVVALCTSAPELVVSVEAALKGSADIALGNIVGSNLFNTLVILGVSALVMPILVRPAELKRDTTVMVAASLLLIALTRFGSVGRIPGVFMVGALVTYIALSYRAELRAPSSPSAELHAEESEEIEAPSSAWTAGGLLAAGLAMLVIGSRLLIGGATEIASAWGVSQAVIGLTLVAAGTSLPELATSLVAAARKHSDVAVGNVVGSNIFNILGILGTTAIVRPVGVAAEIARVDVWVMAGTAVVLAPFLLVRGRLGRRAGAMLFALYIAYTGFLLSGQLS